MKLLKTLNVKDNLIQDGLRQEVVRKVKLVSVAIISLFVISCGAQQLPADYSLNSAAAGARYKQDPKWQYTLEDWCNALRIKDSMTAAERVTVTHLVDYIAGEIGDLSSCAQLQDYLENELTLVAVGNITNLSPYISLKDAKNLRVIALDGQGIRQDEVNKLDFINDYFLNDSERNFRRLTLPDNETGDYATCPLADPDKCRA